MLQPLFRSSQNGRDNLGKSALVLHSDHKWIAFENRQASQVLAREQAIGLELFATQTHNQRRCSQIGMRTDMSQRADRNLRPWRFQSYSATVSGSYGNRVIHIWESWKQFTLDAPNSVIHGWSDTLHCR